jgi:hypothetical protein
MPTQLSGTGYSPIDNGRYILQQPLAFFFRANKAQANFASNITRRYTVKATKSVNVEDDSDIPGWWRLALNACPYGR